MTSSPSGGRPMWLVPGILLAVVVAASALIWASSARDPELVRLSRPDSGLEGVVFPSFALVDQTGATSDATVLDGEVTIVDFIFTHCPFVCPGMSAEMVRLQERLSRDGVRFLSFSVDPERDTPERLRRYAEQIGAGPGNWRFLTGEDNGVASIVRDLGFDLAADEGTRVRLPDGGDMANILHPSRLILVDRDRRVLGLYDFADDADLAELEHRARRLATRRRR